MKFCIFKNVASYGEICTAELFDKYSESTRSLCAKIAKAHDDGNDELKAKLKKDLPVITWQASFVQGIRKNANAQPSGLFMFDVDHVDNPFKLWSGIIGRKDELGILFAGMTASRHGLRLVAKCRPEFTTIAECQKWLAKEIGCDYDASCKDWARSSFVVAPEYTYFANYKALFEDEPDCVYNIDAQSTEQPDIVLEEVTDQTGTLFGTQTEYEGIPLKDICTMWFEQHGGLPQKGSRNQELFRLATKLRYICDFNAANIVDALPACGLSRQEVTRIAQQAISTTRAAEMPRDFSDFLSRLRQQRELQKDCGVQVLETGEFEKLTDITKVPPLPPIFRQVYNAAPTDFKLAAMICQLPILGTLGSRLRARYLDNTLHSPSFQVSLEAPQASGKSFVRRLVNMELSQIIKADTEAREKEHEYNERIKELKMMNIKIDKKNKDEVLGERPVPLIRIMPATASITQLLIRMYNAKGLHLFATAEEIDTVYKAFKRGFSNLGDLQRCAFDNAEYGQDYASENSFSGIVKLYYNTLYLGTPKAMRRFYPDVEDGLVSRVFFVTLPDQFGKTIPVWREFTPEEKAIIDTHLVRLNDISIIGTEVQPEHVMKLDFLNKEMEQWVRMQQAAAVRSEDRTRDVFCRRAAVVGFRAGMLAWFLYGEKNTPTIRRNVIAFSKWIASAMLNQHLLRFNYEDDKRNTFQFEQVYRKLPDEFDRNQLISELNAAGKESNVSTVIYRWKLLGVIKAAKKYNASMFIKTKNDETRN